MFTAIINTPGYLQDSADDNPKFDSATEAWWYLYHERCNAEMDAPCDLCGDTLSHGPSGDCDDDSETGNKLADMAKSAHWSTGTVWGPTPGYSVTGVGHDLGITYSVMAVES